MSRSALALSALLALSAGPPAASQEVDGLPVYARFSPTEVGFIVSGPHARQIFDAMTTPHSQDPCTGGWTKQDASGFNCTVHPDGETQCSFGYNYATQRLTHGPLTC
ncbi:hypothetical protein [Pseudoponticoccus marisrubri]|uniref:Uncharacterized protein n=1 Tax=Pseudoponticoccus marisrubri TaxID=1685382 RepID=A0A0W7WGG0_9RHOB|nr:hypothetical protein [Pseudoponticoccus marisrubri]KUF09677.1 hypothetical protein AVJ23_16110 [Pseudoponticoccus marisrubri]